MESQDFWCMFHFSYPPSKLENVDYSLFKQGRSLGGRVGRQQQREGSRVSDDSHYGCRRLFFLKQGSLVAVFKGKPTSSHL